MLIVGNWMGHVLTGATVVVGTVGMSGAAIPFVLSWLPSAETLLEAGPVDVDISKLGSDPQIFMVVK